MKSILSIFLLCFALLFSSCKNKADESVLKVGIDPTDPPFSFLESEELKGFEIDLARLIAKELNIKIEFKQYSLASIFPALKAKQIDCSLDRAVTEERKKNFDFSQPYRYQNISVISNKNNPILSKGGLKDKKITAPLGSVYESWLKNNNQNNQIISIDNIPQMIEMLKTNRVDGVLLDNVSAKEYVKKNINLSYSFVAKSDDGIAVMTRKNSPLLPKINKALDDLKSRGEIERLEKKWFGDE